MKKFSLVVLLLGAVFGMCYMLFSENLSTSAQSTIVSIYVPGPVTPFAVEVEEGSSFTASVNILDVTDFRSASYEIIWNPAVIEFRGISNGSINGEIIYVGDSSYVPGGNSLMVLSNASENVSGSGTLSKIEFYVIGSYCNNSSIGFSTSRHIYNGSWDEIEPVSWTGEVVHVDYPGVLPSPTPTPSVSPTPTVSVLPTVTPAPMAVVINAQPEVNASTGFQVWVNISNANFPPGDYSAKYTIQWNNNIIQFGSISQGMINTTVIPVTSSTDTPGVLNVVQDFSTNTTVNGSGYLSRLGFTAVGAPCNTSSIAFHATDRSIFSETAGSNMSVSWTGDSVHIAGTNGTVPAQPSVAVVAPAEVREDGSFFANVSAYNISIPAGNYMANYTLQYNANVIRVVNVSSGIFGNTTIPVTNWSYVPAGVQGVVNIVQNFSANATVNGNGSLSRLDFDVVGHHCNNSSIAFNTTISGIYALPSMTKINVSWVNDSVHVFGPTPTPTATATTVPPSQYSLTVNQTSSCCNVSVQGYGNVSAGNMTTFSNINTGTVISVNASYNGSCNTWGNWSGGVGNASAMDTTVTMTTNRVITANCSYIEGADGGVPGWVWPLVAIMSLLALAALGYVGYGLGWWTRLGAGMRGWFGGDLEEYAADGLGEEDLFDDIYGNTGPGIGPGSGGGMEIDDDLM